MGRKAGQFRITDAEISGLVGVAVAGEIDGATRDLLEAALDKAAGGNGGGPVLLDLDECTFVDSMGLDVIAAAAMRLEEEGRKLVVSNARGQTRALLDLTCVSSWDGLVVDRDRPTDGNRADR
jgi:anti-anti-sigma factor